MSVVQNGKAWHNLAGRWAQGFDGVRVKDYGDEGSSDIGSSRWRMITCFFLGVSLGMLGMLRKNYPPHLQVAKGTKVTNVTQNQDAEKDPKRFRKVWTYVICFNYIIYSTNFWGVLFGGLELCGPQETPPGQRFWCRDLTLIPTCCFGELCQKKEKVDSGWFATILGRSNDISRCEAS